MFVHDVLRDAGWVHARVFLPLAILLLLLLLLLPLMLLVLLLMVLLLFLVLGCKVIVVELFPILFGL